LSKVRKQPSQKFESPEVFADEEFDAEDFVESMDDKGASQPRPHVRGGWRRLEELREQKQLRSQLLDLKDWDEFEEEP
jgi:hypothetical protein